MSKKEIVKSDSGSLESDLSKQFKYVLNKYITTIYKFNETISPEFEIRFGTRKLKSIQKLDFDRVIGVLYNFGFTNRQENYCLKILNNNESTNDIRTEIYSIPNIQNYCHTNNIESIDENSIKFVKKNYYTDGNKQLYPINFDDFNFRVSFQTEKTIAKGNDELDELIKKWSLNKKIFRYIKRYEFTHIELPFKLHCSIVKSSKSNEKGFLSYKNIADSNVFNQNENYEIEIEIDNEFLTKYNKKYSNIDELYNSLKRVIKYVLIGLQNSNYPIGFKEQNMIYNNYLKIIKQKEYAESNKINPKDFIGPSSVTLQPINMLNDKDIDDTNKTIPNIRNNYSVTEKADGQRKLLFINNNGLIYLFTTSMNVEFTGTKTNNTDIYNTIIDGEHILHDKNKRFLNLYAAFDIYFLNNKNTTGLLFFENNPTEKSNNSRLVILNSVIKKINAISFVSNTKVNMSFDVKKFYAINIFGGCSTILNNAKTGLYPYETDGLIFTPTNTGVANNKIGFNAPNYRVTWNESFKWKPSEFNTIDFYIKFKKTELGKYFIGNLYNSGQDLTGNSQIKQYITLILLVGFDEKRHGYINPCADIINDNYKKNKFELYKTEYKPAEFYPTNPSDTNAKYCNVLATYDKTNILRIYTEEGDEIEDESIVEFKYDSSRETEWRWIPLRNRYDKTSELRMGFKNYGNAYHVANQNWQSIHNPITNEMIMTGSNIILDMNDDDVYYNKVTNTSYTKALRDFHNLFVKLLLIKNFSKPGDTLIDYAVGKAGDLPKWVHSQLKFVLGIDIMKDNIENRLDGACARYLNYANRYDKIPDALFVNGNTGSDIKSGEGIFTEKYKNIVKAVFGEGDKNIELLGKGVYKNYGICKLGFNISSIQFAIHYMFENDIKLNNFLKNVAECTCLNGYFIGTCYDGKKIFKMLETINKEESVSIFKNEKKIWQITKQYNQTDFQDNETCLTYAIDVYQETINKTFREYLVNFDYLTRILELYGFVLLNVDELREKNIYSSVGDFNILYENMKTLVDNDKTKSKQFGEALNMSSEEKTISFLNKYFIYKKIRNYTGDIKSVLKDELLDKEKQIDTEINELDKKIKQEEQVTIDIYQKQLLDKLTISTPNKITKTSKTLTNSEKLQAKTIKEQEKQAKLQAKTIKEQEKQAKLQAKTIKEQEKQAKTKL